MEAAERLAQFVQQTRYDHIPQPVGTAAKRIMLDTAGCAIGAVTTDLGQAACRVVAEQGGLPQATVMGTGIRTSVLQAAYANARLANVYDFDETFMMQGHHAHSALAGALAACEWTGLGGRELMTAFAVGFEVGARIGRYVAGDPLLVEGRRTVRWRGLVGPVAGVYAACAATCSALGLESRQVQHALGMCANYMAPRVDRWQAQPELPTIKYNDSGWAAHGGVMAALNARAGVTATVDIYTGVAGSLWRVIRDQGGDLDALTADLGRQWWVPSTSFKPWPSCRWIHYALTAFWSLVQAEGLRPQEIDSITLLTFPQACAAACFRDCEVGDNLVHASFSFPHSAAMVAMGVTPGPDWFVPASAQSDEAVRLRRAVRLDTEPAALEAAAWGVTAGVLRIPSSAEVTARGRRFTCRTDFALGDPWSGAPSYGDGDHRDKFRRLARALAPDSAPWASQVERVAARFLRLEEEPSAAELGALLHPAGRD